MESKTKTKISESKIRELVEQNFGQDVLITKIKALDGGMMNSAYLISYGRPIDELNEMILKISFSSDVETLTYETKIMRAEVVFYKHMEGKDTPIPRLLKYDFSHKYIDCDYFFMSKINGVLWKDVQDELLPENIGQLKKELGAYNAVIHSVKGDYFGYIKEDEKWHYDTWAKAFKAMTTEGWRLIAMSKNMHSRFLAM